MKKILVVLVLSVFFVAIFMWPKAEVKTATALEQSAPAVEQAVNQVISPAPVAPVVDTNLHVRVSRFTIK